MLKKENRLKYRARFKEILKKGKSVKKEYLIFKFLEGREKKSQFGFLVRKKFFKKAVQRNKIKRKLREIVRKILPEIKKKVDGILIVLPGIENKKFEEIESLVREIFKKAKVL